MSTEPLSTQYSVLALRAIRELPVHTLIILPRALYVNLSEARPQWVSFLYTLTSGIGYSQSWWGAVPASKVRPNRRGRGRWRKSRR